MPRIQRGFLLNPFRFGVASSSTKLLLHFDGSDGSTTFTDSSVYGHATAQVAATAEIDTAQSVFGGASGLFSGTGGIRFGASANFGIGTSDFTIEFRLRVSSFPTNMTLATQLTGSSGAVPHIYITTAGGLRYYTDASDRISGGSLSSGVWYAVAVSRVSGTTRMFLDGTQIGSDYVDANNYGANQQFAVGDYNNPLSGGSTLQGWIDELRFRIGGSGHYAANYTPAASAFTE